MKIERQNAVDQATESTRYTDKVPKPADGSKKHPGYYTYTDKERLFVFHYLETTNFEAKEAAIKAGYSDRGIGSARQIGSVVFRKENVRAAINLAFQTLTLPKHETLFRLARIATGTLDDVLNEDGELDIALARERDTMHLLKKVKIERKVLEIKQVDQDGPGDAEDVVIEKAIIQEKIEFEIHDPLRALELIGKHERLFIDRSELTGKDGTPLIPEDSGRVIVYLPDNNRGDAKVSKMLPASDAGKGVVDDRTDEGK